MSGSDGVGVSAIEIVEDFSATARCDEGFLRLRRLRCRNRREDGSQSKVYRVDVVDRPCVDAVAVLIWRRSDEGIEILLREGLRPAAYLRREQHLPLPDPTDHLTVREIVAGLLEPSDRGEEGVRARAVAEVWEEGGFRVEPEAVRMLGPAFLVAPGILSEKIFLTEVEVTGLPQEVPPTDGSPLEEGARLSWMPLAEVVPACLDGRLLDAKTELAARRFLDQQAGVQGQGS
ncbi:MAG TPA: NUDIX hydrolase [Myxococcaceae bacterium]|nr:NUDIX hydrolase [Myxococcaceae bacterium]